MSIHSDRSTRRAPRRSPLALRSSPLVVKTWVSWITQPRPIVRTALRWTLLISIGLHTLLIPLTPKQSALSPDQEKMFQTEYGRKTDAIKLARELSIELGHRVTTKLPPEDPEKVVADTLEKSVTDDVNKVLSGQLDLKLQKSLFTHLKSKLDAELKEMSTQIADGKLTKKEIEEFQKSIKEKAFQEAKVWRDDYRKEQQVEITDTTVTQWYETILGPSLKKEFSALVEGWWNGYGVLGNSVRASSLNNPSTTDVGILFSCFVKLTEGQTYRYLTPAGTEIKGDWVGLPGWPAPQADQAAWIEDTVKLLKEGGFKVWDYREVPGWEPLFERFARDIYPHRMEEMQKKKAELAGLIQAALEAATAYRNQVNGPDAKAAQERCLSACKAVPQSVQGLFPEYHTQWPKYLTINQAVSSRVFRSPVSDQLRQFLVDTLVAQLQPSIMDLAHSQFREGLLVRKKGVDEANREFSNLLVSLLRRDVELTLSKPLVYRALVCHPSSPYRSKLTGDVIPPTPEDVQADEAALAKVLTDWPKDDLAFVEKRAEVIAENARREIEQCLKNQFLPRIVKEGQMERRFYEQASTVCFDDIYTFALDAQKMALDGRKQDLADLTADGRPDTATPLVALMMGSQQKGASLEAAVTTMEPFFVTQHRPGWALRASKPQSAPRSAPWGVVEQAEVKPSFKTPGSEAIPFLPNFPKLDGSLNDWGKIRPLVMRTRQGGDGWEKGPPNPILLYAAWNYQGFFFGYEVRQQPREFTYCSNLVDGDRLALFFDTLDSRMPLRGDPHLQDFSIFPQGTEFNPNVPGYEGLIASRRAGKALAERNYMGDPRKLKEFPPQPPADVGPDGSGPYRVCRTTDQGYGVEIFLPRSAFKVPVFAPGWWIGFDAFVAMGTQPDIHHMCGYTWLGGDHNNCRLPDHGTHSYPAAWGDLLMLGTDATVAIQDADEQGSRTQAIVPGHSYLLTVIDPDRNVNLASEDSVLVSAEVSTGTPGRGAQACDVEVFVLKETGKNTGVFRGFINTQPGRGREVQGSLEAEAGQQVRFGYVDFADAKGRRNGITELKLPVVAGAMATAAKRE